MFHSGGASYPKQYVMTSWVDFRVKQVDIPDTSTAVELYLFDCAGDPVFNQVGDSASFPNVSELQVASTPPRRRRCGCERVYASRAGAVVRHRSRKTRRNMIKPAFSLSSTT